MLTEALEHLVRGIVDHDEDVHVDLTTGRLVAHLEFVTGVEEIFDVQVVPGARSLALSGPYASQDGAANPSRSSLLIR